MPWWEQQPDVRLSQGDVLLSVPVGTLLHPFQPLDKAADKALHWKETHADAWKCDGNGVGHMLARGKRMPLLVVSHSCEMDKNETKGRIHVAPLYSVDGLIEEARISTMAQEKFAKLGLPSVPGLEGDWYADFRSISGVDRRSAAQTQKLASMAPNGLKRLHAQLIAFYTRLDAKALV